MSSSDPPSSSSSIPSTSTPVRQDLVQNAITFLLDPTVQSATLAQRVAFLETKGMTPGEISAALEAAGRPSSAAPGGSGRVTYNPSPGPGFGGQQMRQLVAPPVPGRDWRDYFIMAIISGGLTFAFVSLFRRYLLPHLQPPSGPAFQQTSDALTQQFDALAEQLAKLEEAQGKEKEEREREREVVESAVKDVRGMVDSVKEGEERAREEWAEVRREVESVKELVPKMLDKLTSTQARTLSDLQGELKSLKLLLLNRSTSFSSASPSTASPIPGISGFAASNGGPGGMAGGQGSLSSPATPVPHPHPFMGSGRPSIPAWQLRSVEPEPGMGGSGSGKAGEGLTPEDEEKLEEAGV
ncbi:hypothetical protein CALVIDRAFT_565146 [Calocera viscosa TUFC12733]|uniref:Peroxisomal membrane protein PEX14 n=1 Tax=Calocera viscosa (strain TUFC12733) TaxID=1330018 RepID=A0A167KV59_CALVF|nr:hypothetical protein CALVIDRAFT_565146 [Calocera viscosa TUFC12733]